MIATYQKYKRHHSTAVEDCQKVMITSSETQTHYLMQTMFVTQFSCCLVLMMTRSHTTLHYIYSSKQKPIKAETSIR